MIGIEIFYFNGQTETDIKTVFTTMLQTKPNLFGNKLGHTRELLMTNLWSRAVGLFCFTFVVRSTIDRSLSPGGIVTIFRFTKPIIYFFSLDIKVINTALKRHIQTVLIVWKVWILWMRKLKTEMRERTWLFVRNGSFEWLATEGSKRQGAECDLVIP